MCATTDDTLLLYFSFAQDHTVIMSHFHGVMKHAAFNNHGAGRQLILGHGFCEVNLSLEHLPRNVYGSVL